MSRLLKIAGLSALLLASSASAQVPGQHLVYSKTGYAPQMAMNPQQAVAYSVNGNTHYMPTMEATGGAPALYNKAARIPIYAPGPVTYHQQVIPGQVQYQQVQMPVQQVPVQYQQQIIQTEKPVVYEAAVLPVVKGVDGAVQQQQYATAPAPSGYPAQQQIVQGQQYFQIQSGQYLQ
ncbi:MAG: hypothetical protein P8R39_02070 [Alphaproteobacteria bacterium]|nr:hypothetical protein [Alphaproteobacteria bacterium]